MNSRTLKVENPLIKALEELQEQISRMQIEAELAARKLEKLIDTNK